MELQKIMPTYRDLFSKFGQIGEKQIIKILKRMYLRDCIFVLAKLSRHYFKYCQMGYEGHNGQDLYRTRCYELLDFGTIKILEKEERFIGRKYDILFPELSILHLIKLCLKYCDKSSYSNSENFSTEVLYNIGKCLLITNSVMVDSQLKGVPKEGASIELMVNFIKQLIVDKNYYVLTKLYQSYYLFKYLKSYKIFFDIERFFIDKYQVSVSEYFAFLFLLFSQFVVKNTIEEDWEMPHLNLEHAFKNLKPKFKSALLQNFLINTINVKRIDESFFNVIDITTKPLINFNDGIIIPLSLRRLFIGLTDSVYFDVLDFIPEERDKREFSKYFGMAVEDYFKDIVKNIDSSVVFEFAYKNDQIKTPDAMITKNGEAIFFECKKRQFHDLQFLDNGNKELLFERIHEFYFKPLEQICNRIKDFRSGDFKLEGVNENGFIYPVIVCPLAPPILSGGWDKFNFNKHVLPDLYNEDKNIALPEFIDFAELECIEEYLRKNPEKSFVDLIKLKREDRDHHNSNWMVILQKNNIALQNQRLANNFLEEIKSYEDILFHNDTPTIEIK